jgi:hypothetical protein
MTGAVLDGSVKACLFSGPTLWREEIPPGIACYGPVALGSVYRAVEAGYRRIGIIDGVFGNLPAVWHKEILLALSSGVEVSGAASMGALRAAELSCCGMIGVGSIYRMFKLGAWTDDDEVAVVHAPDELDYEPLSEAMSDIRFTLRALRLKGLASATAEQELVRRMKAIHFSARTRDELRRQCDDAFGRVRGCELAESFERHFVDGKRRDARRLLARLIDPSPTLPPPSPGMFQSTRHWQTQFVLQVADVPPLQ